MDPSVDDLPGSPFLTLQTPECLFWSPGHKATLETLAHSVETRQGFVAMVGVAGVGKTTVLRAYLAGIDPQRLQTICLGDVPLSLKDMLVSIANTCGLQRTTDDIHVVADQRLLSRDRQSSEQFAGLNRRDDEMQAEFALVPLTISDTSQEEAL